MMQPHFPHTCYKHSSFLKHQSSTFFLTVFVFTKKIQTATPNMNVKSAVKNLCSTITNKILYYSNPGPHGGTRGSQFRANMLPLSGPKWKNIIFNTSRGWAVPCWQKWSWEDIYSYIPIFDFSGEDLKLPTNKLCFFTIKIIFYSGRYAKLSKILSRDYCICSNNYISFISKKLTLRSLLFPCTCCHTIKLPLNW